MSTPDPASEFAYRQAPHNLEAEQALLGAILVNNTAHEHVADIVGAQHFFDQLHGSLYETAAKLIAAGKVANPITLAPFFQNAEPVRDRSVVAYLGELAANATTIINVRDYARTVYDLAIRRQLIWIGETMVNAAYDSPVDFPPREQIEDAERRLFSLAEHGERTGALNVVDVYAQTIQDIYAVADNPALVRRISTGLKDLDAKLGGGLQPTDLLILAGRPAMGKSGLASSIFYRAKTRVHFFTLEMTAKQVMLRLLSAETGIPASDLGAGKIGLKEDGAAWRAFGAAEQRLRRTLRERGGLIDETGAISIGQLAARARRAKRQHDTELIIVDYLQLLTASKAGGRVQEVTEITTGLKALAKELDVPILALSQLNRSVESRENKRPGLSDLRESGSIEQDADVVMSVYRGEYYLEREKPVAGTPEHEDWLAKMALAAGKAEVDILKARHGPVGRVELQFTSSTTLFSNIVQRSDLEHSERSWPYE